MKNLGCFVVVAFLCMQLQGMETDVTRAIQEENVRVLSAMRSAIQSGFLDELSKPQIYRTVLAQNIMPLLLADCLIHGEQTNLADGIISYSFNGITIDSSQQEDSGVITMRVPLRKERFFNFVAKNTIQNVHRKRGKYPNVVKKATHHAIRKYKKKQDRAIAEARALKYGN